MSTCSLTSAAAGICANTAHQAFLRAGCEQSHTMSPGGTCPPAAASLTGMPAKASRGRCLRGSRGGKGSLSRLSPAASAHNTSWCPGGQGSPVAKGSPVAAMATGLGASPVPGGASGWDCPIPGPAPPPHQPGRCMTPSALRGKGVPTAHPRQDPHCGLSARNPHGHLRPWAPARPPGGSRVCRGCHPPRP